MSSYYCWASWSADWRSDKPVWNRGADIVGKCFTHLIGILVQTHNQAQVSPSMIFSPLPANKGWNLLLYDSVSQIVPHTICVKKILSPRRRAMTENNWETLLHDNNPSNKAPPIKCHLPVRKSCDSVPDDSACPIPYSLLVPFFSLFSNTTGWTFQDFGVCVCICTSSPPVPAF